LTAGDGGHSHYIAFPMSPRALPKKHITLKSQGTMGLPGYRPEKVGETSAFYISQLRLLAIPLHRLPIKWKLFQLEKLENLQSGKPSRGFLQLPPIWQRGKIPILWRFFQIDRSAILENRLAGCLQKAFLQVFNIIITYRKFTNHHISDLSFHSEKLENPFRKNRQPHARTERGNSPALPLWRRR